YQWRSSTKSGARRPASAGSFVRGTARRAADEERGGAWRKGGGCRCEAVERVCRPLNNGPRAPSREVLEVALGAGVALDAEDVGRERVRVELDVVARAVPDVVLAAEEVVDPERSVLGDPPLVERER